MGIIMKNEAKFTKGPWVFVEQANSESGSSEGGFYNPFGDLVMDFGDDEPYECMYGSSPNEHDTALIAAAPEMYEEIRAFYKLVLEASEAGFDINNGDWANKLFSSQGKRYRLLAKARGEK